jgi:SMP-30/Gluconolactonase/LRE-like region
MHRWPSQESAQRDELLNVWSVCLRLSGSVHLAVSFCTSLFTCLFVGTKVSARIALAMCLPMLCLSYPTCTVSMHLQVFYFADTGAGAVFAYDIDERGIPLAATKRLAVAVPPKHGVPDGMTIDEKGAPVIAAQKHVACPTCGFWSRVR